MKKRDSIYNKSTTILITMDGSTLSVSDWARELNLNVKTLYSRLNRGWAPIKVVSTPIREKLR